MGSHNAWICSWPTLFVKSLFYHFNFSITDYQHCCGVSTFWWLGYDGYLAITFNNNILAWEISNDMSKFSWIRFVKVVSNNNWQASQNLKETRGLSAFTAPQLIQIMTKNDRSWNCSKSFYSWVHKDNSHKLDRIKSSCPANTSSISIFWQMNRWLMIWVEVKAWYVQHTLSNQWISLPSMKKESLQ